MKIEAIVSTGEVIERQMTKDELEQDKQDRASFAEQEALEAVKKNEALIARQSLLNRLGITEEEAKLLLS